MQPNKQLYRAIGYTLPHFQRDYHRSQPITVSRGGCNPVSRLKVDKTKCRSTLVTKRPVSDHWRREGESQDQQQQRLGAS